MAREGASEIAERFLIHLFSSAGAVLLAFTVLHALARATSRLPAERRPLLPISAPSVFAGSTLREARDVARGRSLTKAIWDYASWALGCALSIRHIATISRIRGYALRLMLIVRRRAIIDFRRSSPAAPGFPPVAPPAEKTAVPEPLKGSHEWDVH